ncbi:neutral/alkaline non-lysosomal ceramidase N-terminal domain-containing protein [Myroides sp. LJL116]
MKNKVTLIIFFIFFSFILKAQEKKLLGATSRFNITPPEVVHTQTNTLNDSLYIKTILLNDGFTKLALITIDTQGIPQFIVEHINNEIIENETIKDYKTIISATHTHSGIIIHGSPIQFGNKKLTSYQQLIVNGVVRSIVNANSALEPIEIGWGKFDKKEHVFNRRWYMKTTQINPFGIKEQVKMNPGFQNKDILKPAGPTDPTVTFLAIRLKKTGLPLAIYSNYSLHYVGGTAPKNISADYYGFFDSYVNQLLNNGHSNPNFNALMSNGTSGDINNNNYNLASPSLPYYQKMKELALDIAKSLEHKYSTIKFYDKINLNYQEEYLTLKIRRSNQELKEKMLLIENNDKKNILFHQQEKNYVTRLKALERDYPTEISIPLQVVTIGKLQFSTIPFEVFAETGLELKSRIKSKYYFTVGLANGHWGYLPTPAQHEKGGYETWITVSRVEENSSDKIVEKIIELSKKK